nr:hypothetical protein [uncultured Romboutsia sp.]
MKNKLWVNILYMLTFITQVGIVIGTFVAEYLTNKKAGVMHHVYYKRYQFENSIFSESNISTQKIILIILIAIFLVLAIILLRSKRNSFVKIQSILTLLISLTLYIVMNSSYFINMLAYHYFIMAFALVLMIQVLVLFISWLIDKKFNE